MTVYVNGNKIKEMYVNGTPIKEAYSNGVKIFSKDTDGWRRASQTTTLTVTANNNSSIAGTLTLLRFDYYENGAITDRYYQVSSTNLTANKHGVVDIELGADTAVVYGTAGASWEYPTPSNGTITIAADELRRLFRLKSLNGVLELGSSFAARSYYIEPVWDMAPAMSGTTGITCSAGWSICHNRTSRIAVSSALTVDLSELDIPANNGTFPIFAVAETATEATDVTLTCDTNAHQIYDSQCIRTIGFITMYDASVGGITPVTDTSYTYSTTVSKSISGAKLTTGAGYEVDTDGIKVYIPSATYDFSDMVEAAADSSTGEGTTQTRLVYARVTRSSTTGEATTTIVDTSGDSTPFISYFYLGTITVTRNSSTGTIS